MPDLKMTTTELNGQKAVLNMQEINAAKRAARALRPLQVVYRFRWTGHGGLERWTGPSGLRVTTITNFAHAHPLEVKYYSDVKS